MLYDTLVWTPKHSSYQFNVTSGQLLSSEICEFLVWNMKQHLNWLEHIHFFVRFFVIPLLLPTSFTFCYSWIHFKSIRKFLSYLTWCGQCICIIWKPYSAGLVIFHQSVLPVFHLNWYLTFMACSWVGQCCSLTNKNYSKVQKCQQF